MKTASGSSGGAKARAGPGPAQALSLDSLAIGKEVHPPKHRASRKNAAETVKNDVTAKRFFQPLPFANVFF